MCSWVRNGITFERSWLRAWDLQVWAPTFRLPPELINEVGVNLNRLVCIQVTQSSRAEITKFGRHLYFAKPVENQPNLINADLWRMENWGTDMYFTFLVSCSIRKLCRLKNSPSPPKIPENQRVFLKAHNFWKIIIEDLRLADLGTNFSLSTSSN